MTKERLAQIRRDAAESVDNVEDTRDLLVYVDELREHLELALDLTECCEESTACVYLHGANCWAARATLLVNFALPEGHTIAESTDADDNAKARRDSVDRHDVGNDQ